MRLIVDDDAVRLGEHPSYLDWLRSVCRDRRQDQGNDNPVSGQATHPGYGITTEQLADAQEQFTAYARSRITGVGNRDYSRGSIQAFENMPVGKLISELRDEIADAVNYLTFIDIQLSRWASVKGSKQ